MIMGIGNLKSDLQAYFFDELEIVIDKATGQTFLTDQGYCFLSNLSLKGLTARLKTVDESEKVLADLDTGYGVRSSVLVPANTVYRMMLLDNEPLGIKMGEVGANQYIQELAGYFPQKSKSKNQYFSPQPERKILGNSLDDTIAILNSLRVFYNTMPEELLEQFLLDQLLKYHPDLKDLISDSQSFFKERIARD